jgi:hypothetical protein
MLEQLFGVSLAAVAVQVIVLVARLCCGLCLGCANCALGTVQDWCRSDESQARLTLAPSVVAILPDIYLAGVLIAAAAEVTADADADRTGAALAGTVYVVSIVGYFFEEAVAGLVLRDAARLVSTALLLAYWLPTVDATAAPWLHDLLAGAIAVYTLPALWNFARLWRLRKAEAAES